jgi:hypothetical protein
MEGALMDIDRIAKIRERGDLILLVGIFSGLILY